MNSTLTQSMVLEARVPFKSQEAPNANLVFEDCGPACVAMVVAQQTGRDLTPNQVVQHMGQLGLIAEYAHIRDLVTTLRSYGVPCSHEVGITWDQVRADLRHGKPIIALTNYERLPYHPKNWAGGHYVILVSMKQWDNGTWFVNYMDPFRPLDDAHQGLAYSEDLAEFEAAWANPWSSRLGKNLFNGLRQGIRLR